MDSILISDLQARCVIGVNSDERKEKQDVLINIALSADLRKACKSDRFEDAIDYRAIKKRVLEIVEASSYHLVEALAEAIALACLEHPEVKSAWIRVEKPLALRFARTAGVEITRERGR